MQTHHTAIDALNPNALLRLCALALNLPIDARKPDVRRTSGFRRMRSVAAYHGARSANRRFRLVSVLFGFSGGVIIFAACIVLALTELPHRIPHRLPNLRKLAHPEKQHHNHQYQYQLHGTKSERHALNPYLCFMLAYRSTHTNHTPARKIRQYDNSFLYS